MNWRDYRHYIRIFLLGLALIAVYKTFDSLGYLARAAKSFLTLLSPVYIGVVMAVMIYPLCLKIENLCEKSSLSFITRRRRLLAVLTVYAALLLAIGIIIKTLIPAVTLSLKDLTAQLPTVFDRIMEYTDSTKLPREEVGNMLRQVYYGLFSSGAGSFAKNISRASEFVINTVIAAIISAYILTDRLYFLEGIRRLFRLSVRPDIREAVTPYIKMSYDYIYRYITCVLADAGIIFAMSYVILLILGVRYKLLIALTVGIFNVVPYFGAFISAVVAFVIVLVTCSMPKAVITTICLFVLQQADANIIAPRLVKKTLRLRPFWTLVSIIIGGGLFGFGGMIFSVPVMAILLTVAKDIADYREKKISSKDM